MSQDSRNNIDLATKHLKNAEQSLQHASEVAKKGGDLGLSKRVEKLQTDTAQVRTETEKKLSPQSS
jgi:hypothetical protein